MSATLPGPSQGQNTKRSRVSVVSCLFACLSILLFALSSAGSSYAHNMAVGLESLVKLSSPGYEHPWDVPWFNWHLYAGLATLGQICLLIGIATTLGTIISGHIGLFQARRANNQPIKHLATMGLAVGYLCLLLAVVSGWLTFMTVFDFFGWGLTF
jgi:ABC-type phosphate/phosphonate transport system permease subunit